MQSLKNNEIIKFLDFFKQKYPVVLYSNIYFVDILNALKLYFIKNGIKPKKNNFETLANEIIEYLTLQKNIKYVEKNTYNVINNF